MDKIIGFCGLVCTECPTYLATVNDDEALRKATAAKWSEMYKSDIKPENIKCNGCTTPGIKFHHCTECEMRICGIAKGVKNCGRCGDYPCAKIEAFLKYVPDAKAVLDEENRAR
ncbi:MAG: DUF3795 domain-containing protein [Candidatus Thermoplasmatota archaeon]|nr:DUF3795 domain-containing protein [Euryarchaeota archaeon]MBU4032878.1 DUF3795 domain-containing protein [Candidatus Thermoplasmatota archaeon]MBU4072038.1 DUF3795 domain-containing protein [Candidatus Thermoplasmatota archaeon]MBU4144569.1 DUF3795 domain-containing protein [Candidatus Thermoplasmatota archaeon]MBU4592118.1 DUF3795 domain-containing protein [Candidatus Thermoplasmatota archaeon]